VLSVIISILLALAVFMRLKNKRLKEVLSKKESAHRKKIIGQLCFLTKTKQAEEFYKAFLLLEKNPVKLPRGVSVNDEYCVYPLFTFNPLSPQDIADIKRKDKCLLPITIYADDFDDKTLDFAKSLGITLKNATDAYLLFKSANYYPKIEIEFCDQPKNARAIFTNFLSVRHSRSFATSGLSLLFLSFLTPFKIYYVVFGCFLIIFAILSKFYGKKNTKNSVF
jgi:hypothetical protein